ncbi:MAG: hypothetical protein AAGL24_04655 [Pseudomonadota bacterium]
MDEQYVDPKSYRDGPACQRRRCISLTGVLIPANIHGIFRSRFYGAVATALDIDDNIIPKIPEIHAVELFPDQNDEAKFQFLEDLVALCVELNFQIYRVVYYETPKLLRSFQDRKEILGLCFSGLLHCLENELARNEVWPVMESDNSPKQDKLFAGHIQCIDYLSFLIGNESMSIDNGNLGELHYSTKRSAYGAVTDCISYLLDAKFLRSLDITASTFKQKLAEIAMKLEPLIMFDEIIEMKFEKPPPGYVSQGPYRYVFPITPTD